MNASLNPTQLADYTVRQVNAFFPDGSGLTAVGLLPNVNRALDRLEFCFERISVKHYNDIGAIFNHLYSDQYLVYLWFLANESWRAGHDPRVTNKLYLLNKCLHGFDCLYNTVLPAVFFIVHGVGTVLGKASYSDFLVVHQNCTVGSHHGHYPVIGRGVGLGAGASIIGNSRVGDHASVGAGTVWIGSDLPGHSSAYRDPEGRLKVSASKTTLAAQYFLPEFLFEGAERG